LTLISHEIGSGDTNYPEVADLFVARYSETVSIIGRS